MDGQDRRWWSVAVVVGHGGAVGDEFVGFLVAERCANAVEGSQPGGVEAGEAACAAERAVGERAEDGGGSVWVSGPVRGSSR